MRSTPTKLAFIVEGTHDMIAIEAIVERMWRNPPHAHTVRLGGKAAVPWIWSTVLMLLDEKHYDHVVIALDADTTVAEDIDDQRAAIRAQLSKHRLNEHEVSIVFAVPELEAWLIADLDDDPELDSRAKFEQRFGRRTPTSIAERARSLDLDVARRRSPSLDRFMTTLEELRQRLDKAA